jgi:GNAT superfamily N-acetyltransferase
VKMANEYWTVKNEQLGANMNPGMIEGLQKRELTSAKDDLALLAQIHNTFYIKEFPLADERESLENMENCLTLKSEGWYCSNNYHILVVSRDSRPVGVSISDYLAEPDAGVIEFLVVEKQERRNGIGRQLLDWTEDVLKGDAARRRRSLEWIIAEIDDPYKSLGLHESLDPFSRCEIWGRWGYHKVRFPYVQPALDTDKKVVENLLLATKSLSSVCSDSIRGGWIDLAVREYMRWAMRISEPEDNLDYRKMRDFLRKAGFIPVIPLDRYVGKRNPDCLQIEEVNIRNESVLKDTLEIYTSAFIGGPMHVLTQEFFEFLQKSEKNSTPYSYHLWCMRTGVLPHPSGMASFFTLPGAGFGGYIAFPPAMRGQGRFPEALSLVERQMIRDGRGARGLYLECDPEDKSLPIFKRMGYHEVDITYRQPPLASKSDYQIDRAPILHLMYKEFGEMYTRPRISTSDFLSAVSWIFRVIYNVTDVEGNPFYQDVIRQTIRFEDGNVGWAIQ